MKHRGTETQRRRSVVVLLGIAFLIGGCESEPELPPDPLLLKLQGATRMVLDTGMTEERTISGDTLREMMTAYERDTFAPGPRSVRALTDCHPGSLRLGSRNYQFAICSTTTAPARKVMEIALDSQVVRLVMKSDEDE